MKARIHWVDKNGFEDDMIIEAESIEELRETAKHEVERRNAVEYWSSEVEE